MDIEVIANLLEEIETDRSVPRNIRLSIQDIREKLKDNNMDIAVRVNNAISVLDEIANDHNIPIYTRTQIWNIVSLLEMKEEE